MDGVTGFLSELREMMTPKIAQRRIPGFMKSRRIFRLEKRRILLGCIERGDRSPHILHLNVKTKVKVSRYSTAAEALGRTLQ